MALELCMNERKDDMWSLLVGPLANLASELIDNIFETEEERAAAKAKLLQLEQQGQLREMQVHISAILAEAQSKDPWTSRARPSFLYLIYAVIGFIVFVGARSALPIPKRWQARPRIWSAY